MVNETVKFIFWLYGWNHTGKFLSTDDLIKCEITQGNIHIASQIALDIPMNSIKKCDVYTIGGRTFLRHMVKLTVKDDKTKEVFLFPANPLGPKNEKSNTSEVNSINEIIRGFITGMEVAINPNPYYRQSTQAHWITDNLDADTSPWVYYHRYKNKTSLRKTLLQIIITILILVVSVTLLAFLAEYITH